MQILMTKDMPVYTVCYCFDTDNFSVVGIFPDLATAERIKREKNRRLGRDYIDENGNINWDSIDDIDEYYFVQATTFYIGDQNEND